MNETTQSTPTPESSKGNESERTEQLKVAGWTAGVSALAALGTLSASPTWPTTIGVTAVAAMVAVACYFILRKG
jgi:hypothetical protein